MSPLEQAKEIAASLGEKGDSLEEAKNGKSNHSFFTQTLFIRIKRPHRVDIALDPPEREKRVLSSIDEMIAPRLIMFNDNGDKAEERIIGESPKRFDLETLRKIEKPISSLHSRRFEKSFVPSLRLSHYKSSCSGIREFETKEAKRFLVEALSEIESFPYCLSHNDLWAGNIIIGREGARLLDFEFAGGAPSVFDWLSLIEENDVSEDIAKRFLSSFGDGERLYRLSFALDAIWGYWAKARYEDEGDGEMLSIEQEKIARFKRLFQ